MPAAVYPALQRAVLLGIDDNEDVLECDKSFLESFGYSVLTAASGGKGLELASQHTVDVVILDYFMPEMNGQEVAIEMRRLRPQAPIIMLSGVVDVSEQALKWVDAFVAKDCCTLARCGQTNCQNCAVWTCRAILPSLSCIYRADEQSWRSAMLWPGRKENTMTPGTNKPIPKLHKAPQPPLSHRGAAPDSDRAKKPRLTDPSAGDQELNPGDRVEGLGDFGKPTGEFGTVQQTNEDDAVVKWDDDGRMRVYQPSLKKI